MIIKGQSLLILLAGAATPIRAFVANAPICSNPFGLQCKTPTVGQHFSKIALRSSAEEEVVTESVVATEEPVATEEVSTEVTEGTSDGEKSTEGATQEVTEYKHTAYLVNLAYETTNKDLHDLFGEHGSVLRVYIPNDRNTGRPKGIAFVSMSSEEELETVIDKFAEAEINGRKVYVNKAKPKGETVKKDPITKLYIGNISFQCTNEELTDYFAQWGQVKDCYMPTDRQTGAPRGFAFVSMNPDDANKAIEDANGVEFGGRVIEVNVSLPKGEKAERKEKKPVSKGVKVYVGNLSYDTEEETLRETLSNSCSLLDLYMPVDRYSGERRGFAFATVEPDQVETLINELDGYELDGRMLRVNEARPKGQASDGGWGNDNYGSQGEGQYDDNYEGSYEGEESYEEDASGDYEADDLDNDAET